jgi:hypothetical protein
MWPFGRGKSYKKGYKHLEEEDKELEEFDESAVALNAAIEAAQLTAQTSGKISDQIALLELLFKKEPGNKVYIKKLKDLKAALASAAAASAASAAAAAAAAAAEAEAEADKAEGSEDLDSDLGSEGSVNFADDGGKKSRYSRKSKSKYSRKSKLKSKSKYSRKSKSKYSRKSKSKYSRKSKSKYSRKY